MLLYTRHHKTLGSFEKTCILKIKMPRRPIRKARIKVKKISDILKLESFKRDVGIKASEIFVGGSLGQGTVNPEHFDIDIVLYSTSLHPTKTEVVETGYEEYLSKLDIYLKEHLQGYEFLEQSDYAVKVKVQEYKIDLLLSPKWESQDEVYTYLREIPEQKRMMFSVSMSKYQVEFMRQQPNRLKVLVGRFKGWRNNEWLGHAQDGRPKSYLLTMLMITVYNMAPEGIKYARKFKELSNWVCQKLKKLVAEIHSNPRLDLRIPGADQEILEKYEDLLPAVPRIIDPVNPSNNLFLSGVGPIKGPRGSYKNRWDIFARKIEDLYLEPTFIHLYI